MTESQNLIAAAADPKGIVIKWIGGGMYNAIKPRCVKVFWSVWLLDDNWRSTTGERKCLCLDDSAWLGRPGERGCEARENTCVSHPAARLFFTSSPPSNLNCVYMLLPAALWASHGCSWSAERECGRERRRGTSVWLTETRAVTNQISAFDRF